MFGRVTFQKTCQSEAPMVRAASSSARSMVSSIGMSSRTTKGIVTKRVASAIPVPDRDKHHTINRDDKEASTNRRQGKAKQSAIRPATIERK